MADMWYYTTEGKQMDAVPIKELKRLVGDGTLKPTDMVWKEGLPRWIRASSVNELFPDPTSALDQYFTSTLEAEKKNTQAQASGVTASEKSSTSAPMPASSANGSTPATPESPGQKRKTSGSEAEGDSSRPPRRRSEAKGGGSSAFIIVALLIGGFLLLGALVVGVAILSFVIPKGADPNPLVIVEKDKKKDGPDGVAPINGEEKYQLKIPPNESGLPKTFAFKQGVGYEFRVTSKPKGVNVHLFVFNRDGNEVAKSIGGGGDRLLNWTPQDDGDYRIEVKNVGGGQEVDSAVSIKEANEPLAKNDPLPPGVREGKGVVPQPKKLLMPNGGAFLMKFRVKGGYPATISATCVNAKADSDLNIFVYRPNDMNTPIFFEDKAAHAPPNASVTFTLPKTEIVHVLVKNVSRTTANNCSVIYDVSP